jgi:hypothetical protein
MALHKLRAAERHRCYLSARFIFNGGHNSLDAIVRDVSSAGARVEAEELSTVPLEFDLMIGSFTGERSMRRARQIWRDNGVMGVAFVAAA